MSREKFINSVFEGFIKIKPKQNIYYDFADNCGCPLTASIIAQGKSWILNPCEVFNIARELHQLSGDYAGGILSGFDVPRRISDAQNDLADGINDGTLFYKRFILGDKTITQEVMINKNHPQYEKTNV